MRTELLTSAEVTLLEHYRRDTIKTNLVAGIIVLLIALALGHQFDTLSDWAINVFWLLVFLAWFSYIFNLIRHVNKDLKNTLKITATGTIVKKAATLYGRSSGPALFFITLQTIPDGIIIGKLSVSEKYFRTLTKGAVISLAYLPASKKVIERE